MFSSPPSRGRPVVLHALRECARFGSGWWGLVGLGWAVGGWFVGSLFLWHTPNALQRSALFPFSLLETDCTRLIAGNFASLFFGALVWRVAFRFVGSFCFGWLVGLRR